MSNAYGKYYFYNGLSGEKEREEQFKQNKEESEREQAGNGKNKAARQPNEISFLGIKLSYAKAFGIAFLIIFLLLFFPGIGVSSSVAKSQLKTENSEKGNPEEDTKTF
ncbi:MAG: hypothetical protein PHC81_07185 [Clostridia bacterium]|nr:hypothetical protein [Clostridia bacterium]